MHIKRERQEEEELSYQYSEPHMARDRARGKQEPSPVVCNGTIRQFRDSSSKMSLTSFGKYCMASLHTTALTNAVFSSGQHWLKSGKKKDNADGGSDAGNCCTSSLKSKQSMMA